MAVFNEPIQWEHPLGNNADTSTLPDNAAATAGIASLQKLFQIINATPLEAGGIAPGREDVNALFKYLGDSIFYAMNGGVPSYNADYDYIAGRVVSYNGNVYKCIQANGVSSTVVAPDSNTEYWQRLDNFVRSVNGVNADENGNVTIQASFIPDYKSGIRVGPLSRGQAWNAPANGILISVVRTPAGGIFLSHTKVNDTVWSNNVADNWVIYNDAFSNGDDLQTATAIVGKGETLYQTSAVVNYNYGVLMFYPFK